METVLFINHDSPQCGIYQFGKNIYTTLSANNSNLYFYRYGECKDVTTFLNLINIYKPKIVILNCVLEKHSSLYKLSMLNVPIIFIDILHESSHYLHYTNNLIFKHHIIANPNIENLNLGTFFYPLPRLLPTVKLELYKENELPTIGCCGFGLLDRGWVNVINIVMRDYNEAVIKFHMPFNDIVDPNGMNHAISTVELCKKITLKPGIKLEVDHSFLSIEDTVRFLSQNTINLFLYDEPKRKGISSSIDFALASKRPFGINSSPMYEHLRDIEPKINVEKNTLQDISKLDISIYEKYRNIWSREVFCTTVEKTLQTITIG